MANLISGRAFKHSGVWEFDGEVRLRGVALTKLSEARGHTAHRPTARAASTVRAARLSSPAKRIILRTPSQVERLDRHRVT